MLKRLRSFFESIVYAGMRPRTQQDPAAPAPKQGFLERYLSSPASSDPFYLTNQTFGQKARRFAMIAVPVLVIVGAVAGGLAYFRPKVAKDPKEMTLAERADQTLPGFDKKDFKVDTNKDVEVVEVRFDGAGAGQMSGSIRNTSSRPLHEAVVVFDLLDIDGSQLGGVTVTESDLQPGVLRKFQQTISQKNAAVAVVRDVRSR